MERKYIKADVGVIVGRFQVNKLHQGHIELLDWVNKQHRKVILVLGVSAVPGLRENPLDFESRMQMISKEYPKFLIVPLIDMRTNEQWSTTLDYLIRGCITPSQSVVLYGARDSFIKQYTGSYKTQELIGDNNIWSGTKVREELKIEAISSNDFRIGVIWQTFNTYPKVVPTIDVAIVNNDNTKILLGRKKSDPENKWRFIGGFADVNSVSYEQDATREALEETGVTVDIIGYIGSFQVNDWRYKGIDKIRTILFVARYITGEITPTDDMNDKVQWFDIDDITDDVFVEEHKILWSNFKLRKIKCV